MRQGMTRAFCCNLGLGFALLTMGTVEAEAQRSSRVGSSTVQGDMARGEGIYLLGMGQYNLATAMATGINANTAMRWNDYVYQSLQLELHQRNLHRMQTKAKDQRNYQRELARILDRPVTSDVNNGNALNFVLMQLLDPRLATSSFRTRSVLLPGDAIRKIPFQSAQQASTFSMERFSAPDWPMGLRSAEFAKTRKDFEQAIDAAIEEDVAGKLSLDGVRAVESAIENLDAAVERTLPKKDSKAYRTAKIFVRKLADLPRVLREAPVEHAIAEIETYPGTTVGDLIAFMQRHNLRFGLAESTKERDLYAMLFERLRDQKMQIGLESSSTSATPTR